DGGGILVANGGTAGFQNTIVAGNTAGVSGPDVFLDVATSTITDNGGNLIGTLAGSTGFGPGTLTGDPLLGPLQDNGGQPAGAPGGQQVIQTEARLAGGPALGTGVVAGAPATDERGAPRVVNGKTDIGAFQSQPPVVPTVTLTGSPNPAAFGQAVTFTATVTGQALVSHTPHGTVTVTLDGVAQTPVVPVNRVA